MSLPPVGGAVPLTAPDLVSGSREGDDPMAAGKENDQARTLCLLNDLRVMELKQELDRIELMGNVSNY